MMDLAQRPSQTAVEQLSSISSGRAVRICTPNDDCSFCRTHNCRSSDSNIRSCILSACIRSRVDDRIHSRGHRTCGRMTVDSAHTTGRDTTVCIYRNDDEDDDSPTVRRSASCIRSRNDRRIRNAIHNVNRNVSVLYHHKAQKAHANKGFNFDLVLNSKKRTIVSDGVVSVSVVRIRVMPIVTGHR